jgi:hypothetical protein
LFTGAGAGEGAVAGGIGGATGAAVFAAAAGGGTAGAGFGAGTGGTGIGAAAFGAASPAAIPALAAVTPSSSVWQMVNIAEKFEISKTSLTTGFGDESTTFPPVRPTRLAMERSTRNAALLMKLMPAISNTNDFPPPPNHASTSVSNLGEVVPSSRPWTSRMEHSPRFSFVSCIGSKWRDQRDF